MQAGRKPHMVKWTWQRARAAALAMQSNPPPCSPWPWPPWPLGFLASGFRQSGVEGWPSVLEQSWPFVRVNSSFLPGAPDLHAAIVKPGPVRTTIADISRKNAAGPDASDDRVRLTVAGEEGEAAALAGGEVQVAVLLQRELLDIGLLRSARRHLHRRERRQAQPTCGPNMRLAVDRFPTLCLGETEVWAYHS